MGFPVSVKWTEPRSLTADWARVRASCTSFCCCSKRVTGYKFVSTLGSKGTDKSRLLVLGTSALFLKIGRTNDLQREYIHRAVAAY